MWVIRAGQSGADQGSGEAFFEVVEEASGLTAQDVLDDLEVAGPAASPLTAQLDHAAGVGEHLGRRCHGRRDGVLTGRGARGGESAEGEVVEVAVCGRAVCAGDRRAFGHGLPDEVGRRGRADCLFRRDRLIQRSRRRGQVGSSTARTGSPERDGHGRDLLSGQKLREATDFKKPDRRT
ncbi:hypothetical protein ACFWB1_21430 [Streptomyces goshikiensis]|uniref:hypothetical protein n=1 Tax=Streptomyces goshikiensis TaxID=1942 RepID=UPI00369586B3